MSQEHHEVEVNAEINVDNNNNDAMSHFNCVREFHEVFDHPVRTELYEAIHDENEKLILSRISFLREEHDEFMEAYDNCDMVEMADALCDLIYFGHGTGLCFGMDLDSKLRRTDQNNKPSDCTITPSDMSTDVDPQMLEKHGDEILTRLSLISHMIDEFERMCYRCDLTMAEYNLVDLIQLTYELGYYMRFDMDRMFREVHRSNMTKVCKTEADAQESLRQYQESGKYEKPVIRTKGDYYMVYDEALNKILKYYKWEEPCLTQFMGPAYSYTKEN